MMIYTVGESSGKASRSLATYTPGPAGMAYAQDASTSAVSDIARAKMVRRNKQLVSLYSLYALCTFAVICAEFFEELTLKIFWFLAVDFLPQYSNVTSTQTDKAGELIHGYLHSAITKTRQSTLHMLCKNSKKCEFYNPSIFLQFIVVTNPYCLFCGNW